MANVTETAPRAPTSFYDGSPCWVYNRVRRNGYANVTLTKRQQRETRLPRCAFAHRVVYVLHTGGKISGKHVMHGCNNRACCNPAHLRLGSAADNLQQAIAEGRARQMLRRVPECLQNDKRRERGRRYHAAHREERKQKARAYYQRHREALCAAAREYRARQRHV